MQLVGKETPRPMTFELVARLLVATGATVERVGVTRLAEDVFYGTVWLRTAEGLLAEIDARPSDALNLALRLNAPILVHEAVMEQEGVAPDTLAAHLGEGRQHEPDPAPAPPSGERTWQSILPIVRASAPPGAPPR
jgi:bifunctional DNase/RNase